MFPIWPAPPLGRQMDHLYARRTVPPPGEGSSSSAAGSSCHIRPLPPPPPCGWWQQRGPQWESPHTLTASKLLELLHEMGRLSHPASSCLSVFICFRNDSVFVTSIVWPKQLEQKRSDCRLQRRPCRLTKTNMRSVLIW